MDHFGSLWKPLWASVRIYSIEKLWRRATQVYIFIPPRGKDKDTPRGKERKGKERKAKKRKGKVRKGKEREGKERREKESREKQRKGRGRKGKGRK